MAGNRRTNRGNSEESGILYRNNNLTISSDINEHLFESETWRVRRVTSRQPKVKLASVHVDLVSAIDMIDTFDRPGKASAKKKYAGVKKYAHALENKPGKRIPKAVFCAEAGVGRARAEYSICEAEAKGPNASFKAEACLGLGVMAQAEVASASANAGPLGVKVGLGVDTGASVSLRGVQAKFLGTGVSIGPKTSISVLGSEASCAVM